MAEITKPNPDRPFRIPNYIWISLAVLTLAAYFSGLNLPLVGPDEPRYAQVAREMLDRGDWITPTLGGHSWFEKPPLLYWLQMAAYKGLGVNEFAARLGPALCGLAITATLWLLGKRSGPALNAARITELPNWLAVICASTFGILVFSHGASFDIVITFTLTAALACYFIFDRNAYLPALILFYAFVGASLLAKGLIGIVFPFGTLFLYHVISRRLPSRTFVVSLLWGSLISALVAAIWYVPAYLRSGWPFIDEFIIQHHFQRFTSNKYQHPQPFYFYLWVFPLMILPWLPFFIGSVVSFLRDRHRREPGTGNDRTPLLLFAVAWILVPVLFFSMSGSKLPGYILPAVPGGIIIVGLYFSETASRFWKQIGLALAGLILAGTVVLMFTVVPGFADAESIKPLILAADERGLSEDRVFAVHSVPHGAEFYAAARLLRDGNGAQKKLYSGAELKSEMERAGVTHCLAIIPKAYPDDITGSKFLASQYIAENGELAIYAVQLR